ncbi:MAG: hypothetical protein HYV45_02625 [Candidatus Moranbacteria bacterium]|nr:hypothetical protein [Candidatus Moranbacteria bacterium]
MNFLGEQKKKKQRQYFYGFFVALFFVFSLFLFFGGSELVNAQSLSDGYMPYVDDPVKPSSGGWSWTDIFSPIVAVVKEILYSIFLLFSIFLTAAVTLFNYAIRPDHVAQLFNLQSVYDLWKFVRDFFNLFFILTLLYIAFTVVFQIQKDFKKALLSLVLAALFVNFSFPVSRVLIDATNVPMYFFANQITSLDRSGGLGSYFSASKIENILLKGKGSGPDISDILLGIVFIFIMAVSFLVLAAMMVVRLIALLILVIFSSVGFAASIIPGMEKYSKMWWDNFWQYALFGPAAMLMMLISVRFLQEMKGDEIFKSVQSVAAQNSTHNSTTLITAIATYAIPIVLLWFTIGLANKFSIAGAGTISGKGEKFAKWMGKKTYNNPITNNAWTRGTAAGLKERAENSKIAKWVMPKTYSDISKKKEEQYKGYASGGADGKARVIENQHNKKVAEKEKEMEEMRTSETAMKEIINPANSKKYSAAEKEAAANLLLKKEKFNNANELHNAIEAIKAANPDANVQAEKIKELIKKTKGEALDGMSLDQYKNMAALGPEVKKELDKKLKKEGKTNILVEVEIDANPGLSRDHAVNDILKGMKSEDVAKQDLFKAGSVNQGAANNYVTGLAGTNDSRRQKILADLP